MIEMTRTMMIIDYYKQQRMLLKEERSSTSIKSYLVLFRFLRTKSYLEAGAFVIYQGLTKYNDGTDAE